MTKDLITGKQGITLTEGNSLLRSSKKGKLPIVDSEGNLVSLISLTDLQKNQSYPDASKSFHSKQLVPLSVPFQPTEKDWTSWLKPA